MNIWTLVTLVQLHNYFNGAKKKHYVLFLSTAKVCFWIFIKWWDLQNLKLFKKQLYCSKHFHNNITKIINNWFSIAAFCNWWSCARVYKALSSFYLNGQLFSLVSLVSQSLKELKFLHSKTDTSVLFRKFILYCTSNF